jgi:hypothetical protein
MRLMKQPVDGGAAVACKEPRARTIRHFFAIALVATGLLGTPAACVGVRPLECGSHSDCQTGGQGQFCNGRGFCESECHADTDCPCGSFCARSCGLCIRNDLAGPATCFAFERGLTTTETLGACRGDDDAAPTPVIASEAGVREGGVCDLPLLTLPICLPSPPETVADAGPDTNASVSDGDAAADGDSVEAGDQ